MANCRHSLKLSTIIRLKILCRQSFSYSRQPGMELDRLSSITRLSERVIRVLGQNPGKFTLQGTNTYLVGKRHPYILVDTGEGRKDYIPYLEDALKQDAVFSQQLISDIILTHKHHDHVNGLPSVLALLARLWSGTPSFPAPRIHKFPLLPVEDPSVEMLIQSLSEHSESDYRIHPLRTGQIMKGSDCTLHVLHTPGHTADSICLHLFEDNALFTADSVLGQGTAVFEELGTYITSLQSLLAFKAQPEKDFQTLYPGHGPVVLDGTQLIQEYIRHRAEREEQVLGALSYPNPSGTGWRLQELVAKIYANYPQDLWESAARGITLHLKKLQDENKVSQVTGEQGEQRWILASKL